MSKIIANPIREREALARMLEAFDQYLNNRQSAIRCDRCGGLIAFHRLADEAYESECPCGKYRDTLRGL